MSQIQLLTSVINQLHEISGNSSYKYMLITQDDSQPNTELTFHYSPHFNAEQIEDLKLLLGRSSLTTIKPTLTNLFPLTLTKNQSPKKLLDQYRDLFNSLSQYVCKDIAKAWIKILEPNKQALFPYRDYNKLKPDWWPQHVNHIEPDHLDKIGRVEVLINVLRHPHFDLRRIDLKQYQLKPVLMSLLKEICYLAMYERMFYNMLRDQDELFYLVPQCERKLFELDRVVIMTSGLKHPYRPGEVVMASKIVSADLNERIYGLNETNEVAKEEEEEVTGVKDKRKESLVVKLRHRRGGKVEKRSVQRKQTRAELKKQMVKLDHDLKKKLKAEAKETERQTKIQSYTQDVDRFDDKVEMQDIDTAKTERKVDGKDVDHLNTKLDEESYEAKLGSPFSYNAEGEQGDDATDDEYDDGSGEEEEEEVAESQVVNNTTSSCCDKAYVASMLKTPEFEESGKFDVKRGYTYGKGAGVYQYPITPASSGNTVQSSVTSQRSKLSHLQSLGNQPQQDEKDAIYSHSSTPTNFNSNATNSNYSTPYNSIITQVTCPSTPHPRFNLSTDHIKQDFLDFNRLPNPMNNDEFENNVIGIINQIGSSGSTMDHDDDEVDQEAIDMDVDFESDLTDYASDHSSYDGSLLDKSDDTDYEVIDQCELKSEYEVEFGGQSVDYAGVGNGNYCLNSNLDIQM